MRAEEGFQFTKFRVPSPWSSDPALRLTILRLMTSDSASALSETQVANLFGSLEEMGENIAGPYADIAATLDGPQHEPTLTQYDAWGHRIDRLTTAEGWKKLKAICATEGIVTESYPSPEAVCGGGRDRLGRFARLFSFTRIVMFGPVSKVTLCPISMTDGAARVLELYGTEQQKREFIPKLCSTDGQSAWTAGQWMTERPGGSDVSRTETTAVAVDANKTQPGDKFILHGFKWFSSATDGDVALSLARTNPDTSVGSKGLSLFLIKIRDEKTGKLNGIRVHRLKRKLGTKYLPTAELELDGCQAELVGELGRGVATISSVLNITRLYSAGGAISALSHGLRSATAYAKVRPALGGGPLDKLALHTDQLLKVTVLYRAFLAIFFNNVLLMGAQESNTATKRELTRLRLLTPALKAFMATRGSEGYLTLLESFGGQGYMEDSCSVAEALRDATVERIWEGTPSILSLDVLRVLVQSKGIAMVEFFEDINTIIQSLPESILLVLQDEIGFLRSTIRETSSLLATLDLRYHLSTTDFRFTRYLLDLVMSINASALLLQHLAWKSTTFANDPKLHRLAQIDFSGQNKDQQLNQDLMIASLWIGSGQSNAGMADLTKLLAQLKKSTQTSFAKQDVQVAHDIVYSWQTGDEHPETTPSAAVRSHL